jgi:hypothetical protein
VALRGGSRFQPAVFNESKWYFPPALQLSQHGKYLLFDDAYERAATIGFRCAADDGGEGTVDAQQASAQGDTQ